MAPHRIRSTPHGREPGDRVATPRSFGRLPQRSFSRLPRFSPQQQGLRAAPVISLVALRLRHRIVRRGAGARPTTPASGGFGSGSSSASRDLLVGLLGLPQAFFSSGPGRAIRRRPLALARRAALGGAVVGYGLVFLLTALIIPPTVECFANGGGSTSSQRWDRTGGFTTSSSGTSTVDGVQTGTIESTSSIATYRCEQGRIVDFTANQFTLACPRDSGSALSSIVSPCGHSRGIRGAVGHSARFD